jgi:hypothetical protein
MTGFDMRSIDEAPLAEAGATRRVSIPIRIHTVRESRKFPVHGRWERST